MHAGPDTRVWQLRHADLHGVVSVGHVQWRRCVCAGRNARGELRSVFAAGVHRIVPMAGDLHVALGERVRVPRRHEQSQLLGVRVRSSMVLVDVPVEYRVHLVLLDLRWVFVKSLARSRSGSRGVGD
jgi:hypothetical protein